MPAVVPARVVRVEVLEGLREPRIGDPNDRVVVAAHQDVREQGELEVCPDCGQPLEELLAVIISQEQVAGVTAASGEVVDAAEEIAWGPGHTPSLGASQRDRAQRRSFVTLPARFCRKSVLTKPSAKTKCRTPGLKRRVRSERRRDAACVRKFATRYKLLTGSGGASVL